MTRFRSNAGQQSPGTVSETSWTLALSPDALIARTTRQTCLLESGKQSGVGAADEAATKSADA